MVGVATHIAKERVILSLRKDSFSCLVIIAFILT
jgi:hypothetical protein